MPSPLPKRRSVRLPAGEYLLGHYLVTIVAKGRKMTFGRVFDGAVQLSSLGAIVNQEWTALPGRRHGVNLVEHVVMPNHFHAVVQIATMPELGDFSDVAINRDSLASTIGGFKAGVVRVARERGFAGDDEQVWQRSFHEAVLDTDREFVDACDYVRRNPLLWRWDPMRCAD